MPELPEVEVIKRELQPLVTGKVFSTPRLDFAGAVRFPSPEEFTAGLPGRRIAEVQRKGKYLIFNLCRGRLLIHLRMTGRLLFCKNRAVAPDYPYLRVAMPFRDGGVLCFCDMRKFGGLWLCSSQKDLPKGFLQLGPDIYRQVDRPRFAKLLQKHGRARLKPLLLNQRILSGLGNIYTDESLYLSRLHPRRRAGTLSPREVGSLYGAICRLLEQGIDCGGTSIRDFRHADNREGKFQCYLQVYGRRDEPCRRCGNLIVRITVGGRGTYLCPACQQEQPEV